MAKKNITEEQPPVEVTLDSDMADDVLPEDAEAIWQAEVEKMKAGEVNPEPRSQGEEEENEEFTPENESEDESEGETKGGSEEESEDEPEEENSVDKRLREMEERNARLEAELNALKEKPSSSSDGDSQEEELDEEAQDLLDTTPGLAKLVESKARSIAKALFEEIERKKTDKVAQASETVQESTFWGEMGDWFKTENPELPLDQVRQSGRFKDWLASHKYETDEMMAKAKNRYDTSGAKEVFKAYLRYLNPEGTQSRETPGNERRVASARSPSSLSRASRPDTSSDNLWEAEVKKLTKGRSNTRYL